MWLDASKEKPEPRMRVLVYDETDEEVTCGYWDGEWWSTDNWLANAIVNHWQPLPDPPTPTQAGG